VVDARWRKELNAGIHDRNLSFNKTKDNKMKKTVLAAVLVSTLGISSAIADVVINYSITGTDGGNSWTGSFTVSSLDAIIKTGADVPNCSATLSSQVGETLYSTTIGVAMTESGQRQTIWFDAEMSDGGLFLMSYDINNIVHGGGVWGDLIGAYDLDPVDGENIKDTELYDGGALVASTTTGSVTFTAAVPEPATAGLLGISVGALWLIRRLKKAANYYRT
jgi:hypothetical protein